MQNIRSITPVPGHSPYSVRVLGVRRGSYLIPAGTYDQAIAIARARGLDAMVLARALDGRDMLVGTWSPRGGAMVLDARLANGGGQ